MKLSEKDAKDMSKTGDQLSVCSARSLLPNTNTDAEADKTTEMLSGKSGQQLMWAEFRN